MAAFPFCRLTGPANVLVMPAFHSAAISTKMLQELGGATVIGPLLVGLDRSVQIVGSPPRIAISSTWRPWPATDQRMMRLRGRSDAVCVDASDLHDLCETEMTMTSPAGGDRGCRDRLDERRRAGSRPRHRARALSPRPWLRRPQRAWHHRRGDLVLLAQRKR